MKIDYSQPNTVKTDRFHIKQHPDGTYQETVMTGPKTHTTHVMRTERQIVDFLARYLTPTEVTKCLEWLKSSKGPSRR